MTDGAKLDKKGRAAALRGRMAQIVGARPYITHGLDSLSAMTVDDLEDLSTFLRHVEEALSHAEKRGLQKGRTGR